MKSERKNIVWIASYPKSGYTWFRIFLQNLLSESDKPISINNISSIPIASNRDIFDNILCINSSDLTSDEINILRPEVYKQLAKNHNDLLFIKVHDSWQRNSKRQPIFPPNVTLGVIYIIRNPFDVAISYAKHSNISVRKSIANLNNSSFKISGSPIKLHPQLLQYIGSWSDHVTSWIDNSKLPTHLVRYEDLISEPYRTFNNALLFLGLKFKKAKVVKAIEHCKFSELQKQEQEEGFKEKPINSTLFFREGKVSSREMLKRSELYTIITSHHKKTMRRFGYFVGG